MTVFQAHSAIDCMVYGEPLTVPVARPILDTRPSLWLVGNWELGLPLNLPRRSPDAARFVASMRRWTGWSSRHIADILGTSHTTILRIEEGRPLMTARSGDLMERLRAAFELTERVRILTEERPEDTARAMETALPGRLSAIDHLRNREPAKAYLAVLDVLRPRERGMLIGSRPRKEGATAPLHG
jgi:transcriptional regulator with XRE-family HTH domain